MYFPLNLCLVLPCSIREAKEEEEEEEEEEEGIVPTQDYKPT